MNRAQITSQFSNVSYPIFLKLGLIKTKGKLNMEERI
jgi:hypothetical protein